jgi:type IV pilus assembly protein PilN
MIKINLLPTEIHAAEVRRQMSIAGGALGGLVVLCLVGFWTSLFLKGKRLEREYAQAQEELRKYQAIVDKVKELEATRNQLQARRDVIQQLLKGRLVYPKFFEDFMALLPNEIWVNSLNASSREDGKLQVSISAQSLSNYAIADWMTNLHGSRFCSDVVLGAISASEAAEGVAPTLSFSMNFRYIRTEG